VDLQDECMVVFVCLEKASATTCNSINWTNQTVAFTQTGQRPGRLILLLLPWLDLGISGKLPKSTKRLTKSLVWPNFCVHSRKIFCNFIRDFRVRFQNQQSKMKNSVRYIFLLAVMLLSVNAFAQGEVPAGTQPADANGDPLMQEAAPAELGKIQFETDSYDFGKIVQGDVVKHTFTFTNVGEHPLVLESVKPSCGCTALNYTREAVEPGQTGTIDAQFNSAGKMGQQMKYITIVYNGEPKIERIMFQGEIVPKEPEPTYQSPPLVPANTPIEK
jgi:hypothetical protein